MKKAILIIIVVIILAVLAIVVPKVAHDADRKPYTIVASFARLHVDQVSDTLALVNHTAATVEDIVRMEPTKANKAQLAAMREQQARHRAQLESALSLLDTAQRALSDFDSGDTVKAKKELDAYDAAFDVDTKKFDSNAAENNVTTK